MFSTKNRLVLMLTLILTCCAHTSKILEYHNYLLDNNNIELYYQDIVTKLGEPEVYKEFEKDIVASWSSSYWGTATIASDLKGEKLMFTFDKATKKMLKWEYKNW